MNTVLSVKDIGISFGNNEVLKSVNFELGEGEVLGVIGPNGAGKTVLLNILTGILAPTKGEIVYLGEDITKKNIVDRVKLGIGRTFQIPRPFENMTTFENDLVGAVFGDKQSEKAASANVRKILELIGLDDKRQLFAGKLSLLDRKRLEIGVALASNPKILLLDEAAGGLTESEVLEILEIVKNIKESGVSIIWIEHVLQTMLNGTDKVLLLAEGKDLLCGLPQEVMDSEMVEQVYLGVDEKPPTDFKDRNEGAEKKVLLDVDGLNVHYGDFHALHDATLKLTEGSIISIIGSNGAGKSTLLNAIMGINKPSKGKVVYEGEDITGIATSKIVSKGITMSPEGSLTFEDMTVHENLLMGSYIPKAKKKRKELLERVYELFPVLKEKSNQLATFLSGGQRQMLAIARALMSDPKVLICDEISLGLAPVIVKDIYERLLEVNLTGVTILLVEQEVKRSLQYSDYSYVLVKGHVVMEGKSDELSEDDVKDAYFGINKYATMED